MLPSESVLADLVASVYEASADVSMWEVFLKKLAHVTHGNASALLTHHLNHEHHRVEANWNLDPGGVDFYQSYYGARDIWTQRAYSMSAGSVVVSESLCPYRELIHSEFYNDFLAKQDIAHGLFAFVEKSGQCFSVLSVYRGVDAEAFDQSETALVRILAPHLRRAVGLHYRFSDLKTHTDGMEAALNALNFGVIFVRENGTVVFLNNKAKNSLDKLDGLSYSRKKLTVKSAQEASRLREIIAEAARTSSGAGLNAGATMLISRENRRPLSVCVSPLRGAPAPIGSDPAVVLFITNPDDNAELPVDVAQQGYGLTESETKLTVLLLQGNSLKEAAFSSGITYNTAKSQLKSIFQKTRVRRQSELIRLLLNSVPMAAFRRALPSS